MKNLAVGAITSNSITFAWIDTNNTGATYSVYAIGTDTTLLQAGLTTTTYTATGLNGNTEYTFGVVANCAADDASSMRTVNGRTNCPETIALPYAEEFNGYSGFPSYPYYGPSVMPYCWGFYSNGTNTAETTGSTAYYGGVAQYNGTSYGSMVSNNPYLYLPIQLTGSAVTSSTYIGYGTARGSVKYAVMPAFAAALNTLQISFDYKMSTAYSATGAAATLELGYVTGDTSTFVSMASYPAVTTTQHVEGLILINLAAQAPAGARLAFKFSGVHNGTATSSYSNVSCGIDNILVEELPSCLPVVATDTNVTSNSVTLVWSDLYNTGATYTVYDLSDTSVVATGLTTTTYTVTGLTANTAYSYGVVVNCSATDASTMAVVNGRTACGLLSLPWTCGFEADEIQSTTAATALPWCSYRYVSAATSGTTYPYSYSGNAHNGSRSLYFYGTTSASYPDTMTFILPQLDVQTYPMNGNMITFWAKSSSTSYDKVVYVGTLTDPTDPSTYSLVDYVTVSGTTHSEYTVLLNNAPANAPYLCLTVLKGDGSLYLDDITFQEMPSCWPVRNLTIDTSTTSSVTLSWTDNMNNGATYSIAANGTVVASGITADAGSSIVSYTVTGLNAATIYTFSVVANCSADDASTPVEVSIMTPASLPYTTDFETGNAEWLLVNGANGWTVGEGVNNGGSHALYISNDENGTYAYTNTTTSWSYAARPFALNDSNYYVLNFDWKANGESTWDYLRAWLIPGNYAPEAGGLNGATSTSTMNNAVITGWIDLNPATGKLNLQTDWQSVDDTLLLEPGVYTVLLMWANDGSGGTQPPAAVDNFSFVEYVPVPLTVTNLHGDAIAHNAFTAVWNGSDRQTEWHIAMQAAGDTNDLTWQTVAERSVPFFGLTPNTAYNVYVTCQEPLFGTLGDTVMATITTNGLPSNCTAIAEGTTTNGYVPLYGFYADAAQRVQSIYPASMLTDLMGNTYTSMKYSVSSGSSQNWANGTWYVKMGITTQSDLSAGWDSTALTTYYTGNLSANTTDGMTITFDSAFTYNGGNLLVEFSLPVSSGYTSCSFYGVSATGASRYGYSYSGYEAIADGSVQNFLPQLQFCAPYTTTCFPIDHIVAENATTNSVDIYWYPGNEETAWQIAYGTGAVNDSILLAEAVSSTSNVMTLTGLTADADYWFYVRPVCDDTTYGEWSHVNFTTLPTCSAPSAIGVANITNNSATLLANTTLTYGTANNMYFRYWSENGDTTTVNFSTANGNNGVNITGLTSNTYYYYQAYANCGTNDNSRWTEVYTFHTDCDAIDVPYFESFDTASATLACWKVRSNNTANNVSLAILSNSNIGLRFSSYTSASDYNQFAFSPVLNVPAGTESLVYTVNYYCYGSGDKLGFGYTTVAGGSLDTSDYVWTPVTYTSTTLTEYEATIPGNATQVAIRYWGNYAYYAYVDDITVDLPPTCGEVTNLAVDSVTATSVFLSWSDTVNTGATYTIYNDSTVVATGITANNYAVTGLTASTAYTFGVVANCSADNASEVATVSAVTDCANGSCSIKIYAQDGYGDGWDGSAIIISQNGATVATYSMADQNQYDVVIYDTFQVNVCSGMPVTFSWTSGSSWDSEVAFAIVDGSGAPVNTVSDASTLTSGAVFFTMATPCPSCNAPVVSVDTITETSVTISWTGSATSYDVYNGTTMVANVTTNTYTFTGLTAATAYTFGVQAICSATDSSALMTIDVVTACADITTLPYSEGFENGLGCWSTVNGSSDGMPWFTTNSSSSLVAHSGNAMAASTSYYSGPMHANAWLISPKFVLPTINAGDSLNFAWWHKVSSLYPTELYDVMISTTTNDTAAFTTTLLAVNPDSTDDWVNNVVNLNAYAGQSVYIAFHHHDSYDQNYLLIDDVTLSVGAAPVPVPDTLTVTFAVENATMGTTVPAPGTYQYLTGDTVRFQAVPNYGYHFSGWIMSANGENDTLGAEYISAYVPANAIMSYGSMTLTALFEAGNPDSTTITYAVNDATMGTTVPAPGTHTIYVGNTIQATAIPNPGYMLDAWVFDILVGGNVAVSDTLYSDDSEFENPIVFGTVPQSYVTTYNASFAITAIFAVDTTYVPGDDSVTVILAVNDATMGTTNPAPGTYTFAVGDSASVAAIANNGYHFVNWTVSMGGVVVDSTLTEATYSIDALPAMLAGMTINVMANFAADGGQETYWTVTVSTADATMGSVSPEGETQVLDGASFTAHATANEGYYFVAWMSGNTPVSDQADFTFTVHTNTALQAVFSPDSVEPTVYYHVTGNVNDPSMGYVTVGDGQTNTGLVADGETVTLTAHANQGYRFVRWSTGETTESIEITVDGEDVTVTAFFEVVTGIEDADMNDVTIYSTDSKIVVRGAEGSAVYVFDVNGRLVNNMANATETVEFRMANTGVYLVKVGAAPAKRVLVVR